MLDEDLREEDLSDNEEPNVPDVEQEELPAANVSNK